MTPSNRLTAERRRTAPGMSAALFALLLITFLPSSLHAAGAQEVNGVVPPPFESQQFNFEIGRLNLTYDQRIAVEALHEVYKQAYRELRAREITELADTFADMSRGMSFMPQMRQMEKIVSLRRSILQKTALRQRALLDGMSSVMRDDQRDAFTRFRLRHERVWHAQTIEGINSFNYVDLVPIVESLDLPREILETIEPILRAYEQTEATMLRDLTDRSHRFLEDMLRMLREMGFDQIRDEADMMEFMEGFQEIGEHLETQLQEGGRTIETQMNRTAAQIERILPPPYDERFRWEFLEQSQPQHYNDQSSPWRLMLAAAALDDLNEAQRESIVGLDQEWKRAYRPIIERLIEHRRVMTDPTLRNVDHDWHAHWERDRQLQVERAALNTRTLERLSEIVNERQLQELRLVAERMRRTAATHTHSMSMPAPHRAPPADLPSFVRSDDPVIAAAMSAQEFNFLQRRLNLDRDQRLVTEAFYEEYCARYETALEEGLESLIRPHRVRGPEHRFYDTSAQVARINAGRRALLPRLRAIDEAFLDEIDALLSDVQRDAMTGVRDSRSAVTSDPGPMLQSAMNHQIINVAGLVRSVMLSEADLALLRPILDRFDADLATACREAPELFMQNAQLLAEVREKQMEAQRTGDSRAVQETQLKLHQHQERIDAMKVALVDLEARLIDDLRTALPSAALARVEAMYLRLRYPQVYPDPQDAATVVESAMSLHDLDATQRESLARVLEEHRGLHADLCGRMCIAMDRQQQDDSDMSPAELAASEREADMFDTWRFDRRELNETTRRAVRALLREDQAGRVRGLD